MKIVKHILLIFLIFNNITTYAQKVSNINYRQEQSTIIISYDLETKTSCKISLFVSTNDGTTWQGPLKKVTGDAGNKIVSGNHSITWNVLEEFEELRGDKIKFQVRADVGNIETVVIDTQEWKVKNLDVSRYRNGDIIPEVKDPKEWASLSTGAWCYYNNDTENGKIYGKLYNWHAVNDPRGLAPKGYHIPSDIEMKILDDYLGKEITGYGMKLKVIANKIKEQGNEHWISPNTNASDNSGFNALPAGFRNIWLSNNFDGLGTTSIWWSSSYRVLGGWKYGGFYQLDSNFFSIQLSGKSNSSGFSVRCLKD